MRRLAFVVMLLVYLPTLVHARAKAQGFCQQGSVAVSVPGGSAPSTKLFQQSLPSATVTVYAAGTTNLSTIYSDNSGTSKANPFACPTSSTNVTVWFFYADDGHYDVKFSGTGFTTFTLGDFVLYDPTLSPSFVNGGNSFATTAGTLGNINNKDLIVITNNVERARVLAAGTIELENDVTVSGYSAFGGTTLNNNVGTGYVGIKYDRAFTNTNNEVRGINSVVRNNRTSADGAWDFFGVGSAVEVGTTNTQHITGQMKGIVSELYFQPHTYTVDRAFNYQANIPTLGAGVTVTRWDGLVINQLPTGGTITAANGIAIENLDSGGANITTPTAIKIGGINNYGRITWPGTNLTDIGGKMQIGSGLDVGTSGSQGVNAGSVAIGGTTIIDTSANVSTTGYGNFLYLQEKNATAPASPAATFTRVYFKADGTDPIGSKVMYFKDSGGTEYHVLTAGATHTVAVKGSDGNNCNIVFTNGLYVSTTCP